MKNITIAQIIRITELLNKGNTVSVYGFRIIPSCPTLDFDITTKMTIYTPEGVIVTWEETSSCQMGLSLHWLEVIVGELE